MKELLTNEGFRFKSGCNCKGGKEHWISDIKPGIKITLFLRHMTFEIKQGFRVVSRGQENQLAPELIRLFE